jgi:predicted small lipoprotein YifL
MKKNNFLIYFYILFLCGCGTKGDLYIPEEKYPQSQLEKYEDESFIEDKQFA